MLNNINFKPDYKELTDEKLMILFQNEDIQAYDEIVYRYMNRIVNYLYQYLGNREDAEDITQESFIKLYNNKHSYKEIGKFSSWFYTIVMNIAKNKDRYIKNYIFMELDELTEERMDNMDLILDPSQPDDCDEIKKKFDYLSKELIRLDNTFKEVLILRYVENFDYETISEIVGIPLGTVKSRISRGKQILKEKLEIYKSKNL